MASGDAQKIWFPELIAMIRQAGDPALSMDALLRLRERLNTILQTIRHTRQIPAGHDVVSALPGPASCRTPQRVSAGHHPGVAMTSNVKSGQQTFLDRHDVFSPSRLGRAGARKTRRLSLLLAVGECPPSLPPSGACLARGTRVAFRLFTPSRVAPHRGCAAAAARWHPSPGWVAFSSMGRGSDGGTGPWWAMAHRKPPNARARATTPWWACVPRASRRRERWHSRTWAFQLMAWRPWGCCSSRRWRGRRTWAGER